MASYNLVNINSGNGSLPDGTNPVPEQTKQNNFARIFYIKYCCEASSRTIRHLP